MAIWARLHPQYVTLVAARRKYMESSYSIWICGGWKCYVSFSYVVTGNLRLLVNLGFLIISYFMLKILFKYRQKLVIELVKSGIDEGYF